VNAQVPIKPSAERVEEFVREILRPQTDEMAWQWFRAWWVTGGGAEEELGQLRRFADAWGVHPMAALRKAIRYIIQTGTWA